MENMENALLNELDVVTKDIINYMSKTEVYALITTSNQSKFDVYNSIAFGLMASIYIPEDLDISGLPFIITTREGLRRLSILGSFNAVKINSLSNDFYAGTLAGVRVFVKNEDIFDGYSYVTGFFNTETSKIELDRLTKFRLTNKSRYF